MNDGRHGVGSPTLQCLELTSGPSCIYAIPNSETMRLETARCADRSAGPAALDREVRAPRQAWRPVRGSLRRFTGARPLATEKAAR